MDDPLDRLQRAADQIESLNAGLLVVFRQHQQRLRTSWEALMAQTDPMTDAIARNEAAAAALEQRAGQVVTHVDELRAIISELQANRTLHAGDAARLTAIADRIQGVATNLAGDVAEPTPPAPPPTA